MNEVIFSDRHPGPPEFTSRKLSTRADATLMAMHDAGVLAAGMTEGMPIPSQRAEIEGDESGLFVVSIRGNDPHGDDFLHGYL